MGICTRLRCNQRYILKALVIQRLTTCFASISRSETSNKELLGRAQLVLGFDGCPNSPAAAICRAALVAALGGACVAASATGGLAPGGSFGDGGLVPRGIGMGCSVGCSGALCGALCGALRREAGSFTSRCWAGSLRFFGPCCWSSSPTAASRLSVSLRFDPTRSACTCPSTRPIAARYRTRSVRFRSPSMSIKSA